MPREILEYRAGSSNSGRPLDVADAFVNVLDFVEKGDLTIPFERGYQVMSVTPMTSSEADALGSQLMDAIADDETRTSIPAFAIQTLDTDVRWGQSNGWEFRAYAWYDED